jgi:arabinofuranosyltransferase
MGNKSSPFKPDFSQPIILTLLCSLLVAICAIHVVVGYSHRDLCGNAWGTDDAFISYRYAQNLVNGNGLVFNSDQRVEGYSNLLYILLLTPAFLFTKDLGIYVYASLLNIIFVVIAFLLFSRYLNKVSNRYALLASLVFIVYPPLWAWTASGMETTLVLLLQLCILILVEECIAAAKAKFPILLLCVAVALSVLVRPDGFIFPVLAIFYCVIKGKYRLALYIGIVLVITSLGYTSWRYLYYQDFFPNTFYAKVSGTLLDRITYAFQLLIVVSILHGLLPYLWAFILRASLELKPIFQSVNQLRSSLGFETILAFVWLGYWIFIGGDVYYERFLLILLPLGIISVLWVIERYKIGKGGWIVLFLLIGMNFSIFATDPRFSYSLDKNDCWVTLGKFLANNYSGKLLATGAAGKIPYFSNLRTIDMYGLNDKYIGHLSSEKFIVGHTKYDPNYVLAQKPDLITGWIVGLDLDAGLTRDRYSQAGYEIKYLVYMNPYVEEHEVIIDITHLDLSEIQTLTLQGYGYAVLTRMEKPP